MLCPRGRDHFRSGATTHSRLSQEKEELTNRKGEENSYPSPSPKSFSHKCLKKQMIFPSSTPDRLKV